MIDGLSTLESRADGKTALFTFPNLYVTGEPGVSNGISLYASVPNIPRLLIRNFSMEACLPGERLSTMYSVCEACSPGQYSDAEHAATSTACKLCPPGQYTNEPAMGACKVCEIGFYQRQWGLKDCVQCDGGETPSKDRTSCQDCPSGFISGGKLYVCSKCAPGFYSSEVRSTKCSTCPPGKAPTKDSRDCETIPVVEQIQGIPVGSPEASTSLLDVRWKRPKSWVNSHEEANHGFLGYSVLLSFQDDIDMKQPCDPGECSKRCVCRFPLKLNSGMAQWKSKDLSLIVEVPVDIQTQWYYVKIRVDVDSAFEDGVRSAITWGGWQVSASCNRFAYLNTSLRSSVQSNTSQRSFRSPVWEGQHRIAQDEANLYDRNFDGQLDSEEFERMRNDLATEEARADLGSLTNMDRNNDGKISIGFLCENCPNGADCAGDVVWEEVDALFGWWRLTSLAPQVFYACEKPLSCQVQVICGDCLCCYAVVLLL